MTFSLLDIAEEKRGVFAFSPLRNSLFPQEIEGPVMESPNKRIKLEHTSTLPTDDITDPQAHNGLLQKNANTVDDNFDLLPEDQQYHRRYQLTGHKKAVSSVKFSPDGKYLASACNLSLSLSLSLL